MKKRLGEAECEKTPLLRIRLAEVFAEERSNLEDQWGRGENVSTEDLRIALQRYRCVACHLSEPERWTSGLLSVPSL